MNLHNYISAANLVKSFVLPLGYYYPLNKIFSNNQNYAVLCYHRISANDKLLNKNNPLSGLEVNQNIFEEQIKFLKNRFKILSLKKLKQHLLVSILRKYHSKKCLAPKLLKAIQDKLLEKNI